MQRNLKSAKINPVKALETERLILRPWLPSDSEPFYQLNSDPQVMEFFPRPMTRQESDQFIVESELHFRDHGFGKWVLEKKISQDFVGYVGLTKATFEAPFTPCVEIGWRLAREFWGQGYATEGAKESLRYGFLEARLEEVVSFTVPANLRSLSVMRKLGMTHDPGQNFEHPRMPLGHPLRPHVLFRLRACEFQAP